MYIHTHICMHTQKNKVTNMAVNIKFSIVWKSKINSEFHTFCTPNIIVGVIFGRAIINTINCTIYTSCWFESTHLNPLLFDSILSYS